MAICSDIHDVCQWIYRPTYVNISVCTLIGIYTYMCEYIYIYIYICICLVVKWTNKKAKYIWSMLRRMSANTDIFQYIRANDDDYYIHSYLVVQHSHSPVIMRSSPLGNQLQYAWRLLIPQKRRVNWRAQSAIVLCLRIPAEWWIRRWSPAWRGPGM